MSEHQTLHAQHDLGLKDPKSQISKGCRYRTNLPCLKDTSETLILLSKEHCDILILSEFMEEDPLLTKKIPENEITRMLKVWIYVLSKNSYKHQSSLLI